VDAGAPAADSGPTSLGSSRRPIQLSRLARGLVLGLVILSVIWAAQLRPDYLDPTQLGTDVTTYHAAGQRALAGHDLYRLAPGDLPAFIWPPNWSTPLVSPPPIAAAWAVIAAVVPPAPAMVLWWVGALAATLAVVALVVLRGPPIAPLLVAPLLLAIAITAWTGNVNGYLLAATAGVWALSLEQTRRAAIIAGGLVAAGAAFKVGPILLLAWLIGQRRWLAVSSALVTGTGIGLATVVIAGWDSFTAYLDVATQAAGSVPAGLSVGAAARALGLPEVLASGAPWLVFAGCAATAILLRHRPRAAFAIAVVGSVFGLPVVRYESLTLLIPGLVPWSITRWPEISWGIDPRLRALGVGAIGAILALAAVGLAGARTSAMVLANRAPDDVIVRFYFQGIPESFGYRVPTEVTGRAWGPAVGAFVGPVVVYTPGCSVISRTTVPATGGTLEVSPDQPPLVDGLATSGEPFLEYVSTCAELAP
jgi:glycosyl transferase family 87